MSVKKQERKSCGLNIAAAKRLSGYARDPLEIVVDKDQNV